MSKKNRELTPEENEWCETLCICGHLEYVHVKYASAQYPIPCPTQCTECLFIGKALEGAFHEYRGDNLLYLESLLDD